MRESIKKRIEKFAKNRGLKIERIEHMKVEYNQGYRFNTFDFWTNDGHSHSFCEMNSDKRHWFVV